MKTIKKIGTARFIIFLAIISVGIAAVMTARGAHVNTEEVRLYFVDAQILRLIPVRVSLPVEGAERRAQRILDELIKGRDDNQKIRRLIPNVRRGLTARIENETVYVNISEEVIKNHPEGRDLEVLTVYQIVNSLTEIDGVDTVRFTVNGEVQRDFMGYLDMRETFVPDYFV